MSENKLVYIAELKTGRSDKSTTPWTQCVDQNGDTWNLFHTNVKIEHQKTYLFTYHINEKGYKEIEKITPVVNLFVQKAMQEVASKNDIKHDLYISVSYAKDMVVGGVLEPQSMFIKAKEIYEFVNSESDKIMSQIQTPKVEIKKEPNPQILEDTVNRAFKQEDNRHLNSLKIDPQDP